MDKNPFHILKMAPKPKMDLGELRKRYIEIQRSGHPDLGNDPEVSEWANQAYSLLKNDEYRLAEILKFYGTWPPDTKLIGMDFLMEAMEISEAIGELENESDAEKRGIANTLNQMLNELDAHLDALNAQAEANTTWFEDPSILEQISIWYQRRRYVTRLEKNLNGEEEL
jgi:hypothetical protein